MDHFRIIELLNSNKGVFAHLFAGKGEKEYLWKPEPEKWCLLEIACHLLDEEREDFRMRVRTTLENPGKLPPSIDPVGWAKTRKYMQQDYEKMIGKFLEERSRSVAWLKSLKKPAWTNSYIHPDLGSLSSEHFLANWLAHDHMHIRQINRLQYQYLKSMAGGINLSYAGNW
ncbi:MAG: DinB family protein [Cytophagales bacterium]|nr:DinB family protein [Cytophagales bacterium]